jgi:hypothetical protein
MSCFQKVTPIVTPPSRIVKGFNPSAVPVISSIKPDDYVAQSYGEITITGENFFPGGITYVKFGNNILNVTYNRSSSITCYLPVHSINIPGDYTVQVINKYSKFQIPPVNLYSNKETFTINKYEPLPNYMLVYANGDNFLSYK